MINEVSNINRNIDELEALILSLTQLQEMPLIHIFFPGLYTRQILMKKDMLITSKIHKTKHPFFILKGKASVYSDNYGEQLLEAPYFGETTPETRRVLFIHEDCIWITIHPLEFITGEENGWTEEEKNILLKKIEDILIKPHINTVTGTNVNEDYKNILKQRRVEWHSQSLEEL